MSASDLANAIDLSRGCVYTSMRYIDAGDLSSCRILCAEPGSVALLGGGRHSAPQLHWAADNLSGLIRHIGEAGQLYLEFVPEEWAAALERAGFSVVSEFVDFILPCLRPENEYGEYASIEFMADGEAEAVCAVATRCAGTSRGFFGDSAQFYLDWRKEENGGVIVARQDGELSGFCCVATYGDADRKTLWLREIAVRPDRQGAGVGTRLVAQALCYGARHGARKAFLLADAENAGAIRIYERFGFARKKGRGQINMMRR